MAGLWCTSRLPFKEKKTSLSPDIWKKTSSQYLWSLTFLSQYLDGNAPFFVWSEHIFTSPRGRCFVWANISHVCQKCKNKPNKGVHCRGFLFWPILYTSHFLLLPLHDPWTLAQPTALSPASHLARSQSLAASAQIPSKSSPPSNPAILPLLKSAKLESPKAQHGYGSKNVIHPWNLDYQCLVSVSFVSFKNGGGFGGWILFSDIPRCIISFLEMVFTSCGLLKISLPQSVQVWFYNMTISLTSSTNPRICFTLSRIDCPGQLLLTAL